MHLRPAGRRLTTPGAATGLQVTSAPSRRSLCADLTFDHAGERAVTDGGPVAGHMTLLAQQPALVEWSLPLNFGSEFRAQPGLDEALHGLRSRQRVEPLVAGGAARFGLDAADQSHPRQPPVGDSVKADHDDRLRAVARELVPGVRLQASPVEQR